MNSEPLVSIVMPFYNGHEYIAESVKSVLAQKYRNYELIVVNDGSREPSPREILAGLDCSKITFIDHERNQGLSAARNTGFLASRGELTLPLDCDDLIVPEFLSETVAFITSNPDVDAVYTQVRVFGNRDLDWTPDATLINIMCGIPIPSTVLYWRRIFDLVGGYNTSLKYSQDSDFWIRVLSRGTKLHRIDQPLFHYRKHADSLSNVGQLTEVSLLAEANEELYTKNYFTVLAREEEKYLELKAEYAKLEAGFRLMESGYADLLRRYDKVVADLRKASIRYHLQKLMPFLDLSPNPSKTAAKAGTKSE